MGTQPTVGRMTMKSTSGTRILGDTTHCGQNENASDAKKTGQMTRKSTRRVLCHSLLYPWGTQPTVGRMTMKSTQRNLGHSLLFSLACLYRTRIQLLCAACIACALLRSFVCLYAHSPTRELMGKRFFFMKCMRRFPTLKTHCAQCIRFFLGLFSCFLSHTVTC